MIFKISSFLTFALALSSLEAVIAYRVLNNPRNGELNKRSSQNISFSIIEVSGSVTGRCGFDYNKNSHVIIVPALRLDCTKTTTLTYNGKSLPLKEADSSNTNNFIVTEGVIKALGLNLADALRMGRFQGTIDIN